MPLMLRLPGSEQTWTLPATWTDAELRFAWKVARDEGKELRIELQPVGGGSTTMLIMYPQQIPWYELVGASPTESSAD